jgi:hypothetical protein
MIENHHDGDPRGSCTLFPLAALHRAWWFSTKPTTDALHRFDAAPCTLQK